MGKSASGAIAHGVYLLAPKRWSVETRRLLSSVAGTLTFVCVATFQQEHN
jgi:hypothetical protein